MVALVAAVAAPAALAQGVITGKVVDEDDNPVSEATVTAESQSERFADVKEVTTGSDGRFSMIGLRSGPWKFSVSADGYHPTSDTGRVQQTQNPPLDVVLQRIRRTSTLAVSEDALASVDPEDIEQEVDAAHAAFNAENWDAAIAGYTSVLEKLPELTDVLLYIGQAHWAKGENEEALAAYERLLAADPTNEEVKGEIARTKLSMGDLESASAGLEAAASSLDATREDLFNLGELEFVKGEMDAAAGWYEKAAIADPNWGLPPYKLALIALNKGDYETAKQFFEKVIEVDPNSEEAAQAKATIDALP
jgi:tetratricopeptide (TPR) repeat protein